MEMNEYQKKASETAIYPNVGNNPYYPALGLGGETGEVLNKVKKIMRDFHGDPSPELMEDIAHELGDVLWYVAQLCTELDMKLDDIAKGNIAMLSSRKQRGVLGGNGEKR